MPVASVSTMYTEGEEILLGTSGDAAVTTSGYSNLRIRNGNSFTVTTPGNNPKGVREPELLSTYDTDSQYYNKILGFGSKEAMGEAFVADYEAMITGSSENWKANNIYDLAENCYEWTQEAYTTQAK